MMAAGKKATADGSVLVARSCDAPGGDDVLQIRAIPRKSHDSEEIILIPETRGTKIPQISETYAYLAAVMVVDDVDIYEIEGGINEHQVSAGASTGGWLNTEARRVCRKSSTSLGDHRMTLVLERCKTAREAVDYIGTLTEKYGARTDNYIVADPDEAWFYEEYQGNLWAAARVPDDCFVVQANTVRIDFISDDTEYFRHSPNLVDFAVEHGLYDPKSDGPFNPSIVYGAQTGKTKHNELAPEFDRRRIWRGICLLAPSSKLDPERSSLVYPLFIKPDKKLTPRDLLKIFEDHYQGTKYDIYESNKSQYKPPSEHPESLFHLDSQREYQYAPTWGAERIIGTQHCITNWCAQLRNWMPNPIGGLIWMGLSQGATSGRIPFYCGISKTPEAYNRGKRLHVQRKDPTMMNPYDPESAYWSFRIVTSLVNLFYTATRDSVIPIWRQWEEENFEMQNNIETTALELYKEDPDLARSFITKYSCAKADEAHKTAKKMAAELFTIISHYNGWGI
jgi:dipeptidase